MQGYTRVCRIEVKGYIRLKDLDAGLHEGMETLGAGLRTYSNTNGTCKKLTRKEHLVRIPNRDLSVAFTR